MMLLWFDDVLLTVFFRNNVLLGKLTQCHLCFSTCDNNVRHYWGTGNKQCSGSGPGLASFGTGSLITCKDPDFSVISKENN
jgi:hypothetical protein